MARRVEGDDEGSGGDFGQTLLTGVLPAALQVAGAAAGAYAGGVGGAVAGQALGKAAGNAIAGQEAGMPTAVETALGLGGNQGVTAGTAAGQPQMPAQPRPPAERPLGAVELQAPTATSGVTQRVWAWLFLDGNNRLAGAAMGLRRDGSEDWRVEYRTTPDFRLFAAWLETFT